MQPKGEKTTRTKYAPKSTGKTVQRKSIIPKQEEYLTYLMSTVNGLSAITEDTFQPKSKVYKYELQTLRFQALMARIEIEKLRVMQEQNDLLKTIESAIGCCAPI
jgi:hypothetical protein